MGDEKVVDIASIEMIGIRDGRALLALSLRVGILADCGVLTGVYR
jgi:hypothetical protein